ncbi:MAG TPA: DUF480 domain-containing protein [Acidimicrobiales bacterium]|nr:DUF480 domain-containing protein [Acidimicrobiales bacterium]
MRLSSPAARVLGSLVEKGLTTPQQYPLTLNALVSACNQASNREPVVSYDEATVEGALHELKDEKLVRFVLPSHGRSVVRYRHVLDETWGLDAGQSAILAMLLLRGPQTVGELRTRSERMVAFDGLDGVEHELELLAGRAEPLAVSVARRPGQKEGRWTSTLVAVGDDDTPQRADALPAGHADPSSDRARASSPSPDASPLSRQVDELRAEVAGLRAEVAGLRAELEELRASLGG